MNFNGDLCLLPLSVCVCSYMRMFAVSRRGEKQQLPLQGYTVGLFTKKMNAIS